MKARDSFSGNTMIDDLIETAEAHERPGVLGEHLEWSGSLKTEYERREVRSTFRDIDSRNFIAGP
jgi:hypothetical protein